jgi:hypothetical protein
MADKVTKRIRAVGKIMGAAGIVAAMAFGFSWIGQGDGFVSEAGADIVTSTFAPKTEQAKFVDSLRESGFSKPRMYDYDGNTVFFSTKTTRKSPLLAARELQETFYKNGVNERTYNGLPKLDIREEEKHDKEAFEEVLASHRQLFDGQMVPVMWTDDEVRMGGLEMEGEPESHEILEAFARGRNILEGVKRIRYVDAFRSSPTGKTTMTATWSDDDLDFRKFASAGAPGTSVDRTVPACPGCNRVRRFGGTEREASYVENVYEGRRSPDQMRMFYRKALAKRGWKLSDSSKLIQEMERQGFKQVDKDAQFDAYARGKTFLHVLTYRDRQSGLTNVHIMRGP